MKAVMIGLALSMAASSVLAEKPAWAGQPKEDGREEYRQHEGDREDRRQDKRQTRRVQDDDEQLLPMNDRDRRRLRDWVLEEHYDYRPEEGKRKSLPPGLRKKLARGGELPPGWQDKVRRGEVFDNDYYRYGERLPRRYLDRLGYDSEAAELILLGDRIVRVAEGRGTILDVVELTDKALEALGN